VVFRLTEEEKAELKYFVKKAQRVGDFTQSDLCRVAVTRFLRSARNGGRKWLIEQINLTKGGGPGNEGLSGEEKHLTMSHSLGAESLPPWLAEE
jgi:hypothetical protein